MAGRVAVSICLPMPVVPLSNITYLVRDSIVSRHATSKPVLIVQDQNDGKVQIPCRICTTCRDYS